MAKLKRVTELIEKISDLHDDTLIEDIKMRCYLQLQILKAIVDNGYVDSSHHKFIEVWNYNCRERDWGKENTIE